MDSPIDLSPLCYRTAEPVDNSVFFAFAAVDAAHATLYSDVVFTALPHAARTYLEALMTAGTYEYQSDFVRRYVFQGRAEGRAEGEVRVILAVLDARSITLTEDERAWIAQCTDLDQLETWARRAANATSVHDLFD